MPAAGARTGCAVCAQSSQGQGSRSFHAWRRCMVQGMSVEVQVRVQWCAQTIPSKQLGDRRGLVEELQQRRRTTD